MSNGMRLLLAEQARRKWDAYDALAEQLGRAGAKWRAGDPVPAGTWLAVADLVDEDPEAFEARVRAFAYADAMEAIPAFANDGDGTDPEYTEKTVVDRAPDLRVRS